MSYSKAEIYGNAALNHDQVRAVRLRRGESPRVVGRDYGVAPETIRKIWRGDTYTMVEDREVPPSEVAIQASIARTLELAGMPKAPASLEEALQAQALREEGVRSPGLAKLEATVEGLHKGDRLVDELAPQDPTKESS